MKKRINNFLRTENRFKIFTFYLIVGLIGACSVTLGRYAFTEIQKYFVRTKRFYFNCDKLSDNGQTVEMTNWSGVGSYTVKYNMNSYSNQLLKSEEDIDYDITYQCSNNVVCSVVDNKTGGTISRNTNVDDFTIVITVPPQTILHDRDAVELNVEAVSSSPYIKRLYGTFRLVVGHYGLSYEIEDSVNSPYLNTRITNTLDYYVVRDAFGNYHANDQIDMETYQALTASEQAKCASSIITLSFDPTVVLLDMTSEVYQRATNVGTIQIGGYNYVNSISFKIDAMSSEIVKFYKNNVSMNYTYPAQGATSIITVSYS